MTSSLRRPVGRGSDRRTGSRRTDLPTPSLVLDLAAFRRNASRISESIRSNGAVWRPHVKSHRSPFLARLQIGLGARGITCGTVGEARAFVAAGFDDILIANVIASPAKWVKVARLQKAANVIVCVDDPSQVASAARAADDEGVEIPLYVEVDIGLNRTGTDNAGQLEELVDLISDSRSLRLAGVMGYEGHCLAVWPRAAKEQACQEAIGELVHARELMLARGVDVNVVSCGGTGTYDIVSRLEGVTEVQAGGGCLMDVLYEDVFHVSDLEPALWVDTEVVSARRDGSAIVDAGLKSVSAHSDVMPRVCGYQDVEVVKLSAEHGALQVGTDSAHLEVGERLSLIPGRIDTTVFLHDTLFLVEEGVVLEALPLSRHNW